MLIEFAARKVIVAGAARGIGRCIALEFARRGAEVHACDILIEEVIAYAGDVEGPVRVLDYRADPSRDGIARRLKLGGPHDRTEAARALAMAGRALAQAHQPGARRAQLPAGSVARRCALRLRPVV